MLTKHDAGYWTGIVPGDTVTLNDAQLMEQFMEKLDDVTKGADFEVERVQRVKENSGICEWVIIQIYSREIDARYWLVALIMDAEILLRVYYQWDDFLAGTRDDHLEEDRFWMFDSPADPKHFITKDLGLAKGFIIDLADRKGVEFKERGDGAFVCSLSELPRPSGAEEMFVTIKEYRTEADIDNPLVMMIEIGTLDNPESTLLTFMNGCDISSADVEVLHTNL